MADSAEQADVVLLEAHARPAAIAKAAASQFGADRLNGDRQAGRKSLDDDDEGGAVGLASGKEAEHGLNLPGQPSRLEAVDRQSYFLEAW